MPSLRQGSSEIGLTLWPPRLPWHRRSCRWRTRCVLHIRRQRTNVIDTGKVAKLADLLESDLDLAARNYGADKHAGRCLLEPVLDSVAQAQLLEQANHVHAAWTRGISDRFGRQ